MSKGAGRRAVVEHLAAQELARKARQAEREAAKPVKSTVAKAGKVQPSRPMTAAERREKDFARVQLQPDAAALPANADVQVERAERAGEGQRGNVERARRMDAFESLRSSMARHEGAYDAARRLEKDVLMRRGEADTGAPIMRVDSGKLISPRQYAMAEAGERVDAIVAMLPRRDAWLILELISPTSQATKDATCWRGVVEYVTGETHVNSQGTVVRSACINLAEAYAKQDNLSRRAA